MVLSRSALPERVGGEGRGWGMACGACTAPGVEGSAGGGRGWNQDVLSCYLANTSSGLVCRWLGFAAEPDSYGTRRKSNLACSRTDFSFQLCHSMQRGISSDSKCMLIIALWLLRSGKLAIKLVQTAQVSDVFFSPLSPLR